ncbi:MAG: ISL3 family transposase [Candidatus Competibacteraceae bacterium]|nr:ISL3 family transposase [Candidatus Competibacteraceae bacterium]
MLTNLLLPWLTWLDLDEIYTDEQQIAFMLTSTQCAACPQCHQPSHATHSQYQRRIADLPCAGMTVGLQVQVRKFFCRNPACRQVVFSERLSSLAAAYARRTQRLSQEQQRLGLDLGGEVGARTAQRQGMPVSADTILRLVRQAALPELSTPRKLGVDDWAIRKGTTYGTILVDLERHKPVDLLPDRTAATLERWLKEHPGVEIITRDRANDYAEGASRGAPDAIQVADRFHLLQNVREMLQRLLDRHQAALRAAAMAEQADNSAGVTLTAAPEPPADSHRSPFVNHATHPLSLEKAAPAATLPKAERQRQIRRAQRLERYQNVRELHKAGVSQRAIARQLDMSFRTVRAFVKADQFPERATPRPRASKLDPFLPYLRQQLAAGGDNGMQLWRNLRDQYGYTGSRALVSRWVAQHRHLNPKTPFATPKPKRRGKPPLTPGEKPIRAKPILSARQAAWLLVRPPEDLEAVDRQRLQRLCLHASEVQTAYELAQEFIQMVRTRTAASFDDWLLRLEAAKIPELQSFAAGLRRDQAAVCAALSLPESNGQVEGQINRLKFIKRSMYGRAKFDLLRQRVLAA